MKKLALIDYGAGNLRSVYNALQRLQIEVQITRDPQEIRNADRVIFPGVGAAAAAMKQLEQYELDRLIPELEQPVLGICLGMQLLCDRSEEGDTTALGIVDRTVTAFRETPRKLHMGWNQTTDLSSPLFEGIEDGAHFYYVHGYYVPNGGQQIGSSVFGQEFCAALQKDNFYGVQFHPEKSGPAGARVLSNFIEMNI